MSGEKRCGCAACQFAEYSVADRSPGRSVATDATEHDHMTVCDPGCTHRRPAPLPEHVADCGTRFRGCSPVCPKEQQERALRDWPEDASHENGNYLNRCIHCDLLFTGHKRRIECRACCDRTLAERQARDAAPAPLPDAGGMRGMTKDEAEAYEQVVEKLFDTTLVPAPTATEATGEMGEEDVIDVVSSLPGDAAVRQRILAHDAALRSRAASAEIGLGKAREEVERWCDRHAAVTEARDRLITQAEGLSAEVAALRSSREAERQRADRAEEQARKWRRELSAACELSERSREIVVSALNQPPEYFYDRHDNGEWSAEHAAFAIETLFRERDEAREQLAKEREETEAKYRGLDRMLGLVPPPPGDTDADTFMLGPVAGEVHSRLHDAAHDLAAANARAQRLAEAGESIVAMARYYADRFKDADARFAAWAAAKEQKP